MPTKERVDQLLEIVMQELDENHGTDLGYYHDWDHLIGDEPEHEDVMTLEEWEWCRDHMKIERSVSVSLYDLEGE